MIQLLEQLKEENRRLSHLLAEPQDGLASWCSMVAKSWRRIAELWDDEGSAAAVEREECAKTAEEYRAIVDDRNRWICERVAELIRARGAK